MPFPELKVDCLIERSFLELSVCLLIISSSANNTISRQNYTFSYIFETKRDSDLIMYALWSGTEVLKDRVVYLDRA